MQRRVDQLEVGDRIEYNSTQMAGCWHGSSKVPLSNEILEITRQKHQYSLRTPSGWLKPMKGDRLIQLAENEARDQHVPIFTKPSRVMGVCID